MFSIVLRISALVSMAASLFAQEYRATLVGNVTDQSGAAVSGAAITVTNMQTGVAVSTRASQEGGFVAPFLVPGNYEVTVQAPGFKVFARSPIELRVNDRTRVDVRLELGQASDKVTVIAEAPLIETGS